ncbi:MAG: ABC transporter ATP-binding protein [Eubacteriaceae bacterium]|nr:ABC transporter ATP-binding protein [Eubacteriaceae bacterium]
MDALEIKGLCKSYSKKFELKDISFSVPMGCAVGLVGENGAGKSTTIALINDMIEKDSGTVKVLGADNSSAEFRSVREMTGTVLDEACFPDGLRVSQVGKVCSGIFANWDQEAFRSHVERFDLPDDRKFKDFSRGMKMKLSLAVALSHGAKLLILDEATGGLDPIARDELIGELADFISDGQHAILLSSHIISDIEKLCDRIVFIHRGKMMFDKSRQELLENVGGRNLEEVILDMVRGERQ